MICKLLQITNNLLLDASKTELINVLPSSKNCPTVLLLAIYISF